MRVLFRMASGVECMSGPGGRRAGLLFLKPISPTARTPVNIRLMPFEALVR